ncbi:MAG: hypothetical protein M1823_005163 [Watsoniomyces obsoletus]|nr:MAG: hypothetical protein M1823_005163 [Watsoniomyces obsoletus]
MPASDIFRWTAAIYLLGSLLLPALGQTVTSSTSPPANATARVGGDVYHNCVSNRGPCFSEASLSTRCTRLNAASVDQSVCFCTERFEEIWRSCADCKTSIGETIRPFLTPEIISLGCSKVLASVSVSAETTSSDVMATASSTPTAGLEPNLGQNTSSPQPTSTSGASRALPSEVENILGRGTMGYAAVGLAVMLFQWN